MAREVRRASGSGFLLVGDAAGFLDPFTGDGIYEAICGATLAAPIADTALRRGDVSDSHLRPYEEARRQQFAAKQRLRLLVQAFVAKPELMDYAFARLARRPSLARTLTGALAGFTPAEQAVSPHFLMRLLRP
jgi:flavin-dependent dehydrogenase